MTTRYAYAPRGVRANTRAPRNHGPNVTVLAALTLRGMGPAMVVPGPTTRAVFEAYVAQVLAPTLHPGQVVILDNLAAHTGAPVRALIEAAGCELRFLPPYSPDFSPIEWALAKLKAGLRRAQARSFDELLRAIGQGLAAISAADARGWFYGCGYLTALAARQSL
jgi:transposase